MLVYGENDPWSAGTFHVDSRNDSVRYFVPEGNHGAYLCVPVRPFPFATESATEDLPVVNPALLRRQRL